MSSRAYVAHDHAVSVVRMYFQMVVVGLVLAVVLYSALMAGFLSYYVAAPIPEIRTVNGQPHLVNPPRAGRLPLIAMLKYFVSLNPKNYIRWNPNPRGSQPQTPQERVDRELLPFFQRELVPRNTYRKGVRLITHGRIDQLPWIFASSLVFFPAFGVLYFFVFRQVNKRISETRFVRGADLTPLSQMKEALAQAIAEEKQVTPEFLPLQLGVLALPESVSRRHIFVAGTTGTGKSVCLNQYIRSLHRPRAASPHVNKSVIYDVKGEFTSKHHREGDVIFYPFDRRSIGWSFFNEVLDYPDLDVLSTSLYEAPKDCKDPYWYKAARDVFRTGLFYLLREGKTSNLDIWEFFSYPLQEIRDCLYTLPMREMGALKHIDKADSQQAASVVSILQERLTFFRYLTDRDGTFSFRQFIQNDKDKRSLFLMNIPQYDAIFQPLMTFVIDIMTREVLSLPDSHTRRITFLIDEFGSLAKMPSIFDFLTMGRSKGGFLVLANQDLGSVGNIYGHDQKETFFNNFNLHLIFRINDPTTAEFLSRAFGEREVVKKFSSSQMSPTDLGDRISISEQEKLEKIILPTQFQDLKDFHAYLKIANHGVTTMKTPRKFLPTITDEFLPRDFDLQQLLKEAPASPPTASIPGIPEFAP
jgi:type IV secretory pathway TraG/TraD family ATPase VirD4